MKFGFIGTGNMAGALVRALAKQSGSIALANRTPAKAEALAAEVGGVVWRNEEVAAQCQYIFLSGFDLFVCCAVNLRCLLFEQPLLQAALHGGHSQQV